MPGNTSREIAHEVHNAMGTESARAYSQAAETPKGTGEPGHQSHISVWIAGAAAVVGALLVDAVVRKS